MESGPWAIKGALLNLQLWSTHLPLGELDFQLSPVYGYSSSTRSSLTFVISVGWWTTRTLLVQKLPKLHPSQHKMPLNSAPGCELKPPGLPGLSVAALILTGKIKRIILEFCQLVHKRRA